MIKKIVRLIKQFSGSDSDRHRNRRNRPYRGSSSSGRRNYNKYGGSHRYKRRNYSSS